MSLLLDDEDDVTYCPPLKVEKTETAATSTQQSPGAAAATPAAGDVFHVKGGDGMDKMAALAFGRPRVSVNASKSPQSRSRSQRAAAATPVQNDGGRTAQTTLDTKPSTTTTPTSAARTESTGVARTTAPEAPKQTVNPASQENQVARTLAMNVEEEQEQPKRPTKPAPTAAAGGAKQMSLTDFFSKMACKKKE